MIKKSSEIIVDILIQNGQTQYNRGVYVYGMECIISELSDDAENAEELNKAQNAKNIKINLLTIFAKIVIVTFVLYVK